jgi:signal peptidase I
LVQPELHTQNEGREGDGNPGQPVADPPSPGIPETLAAGPGTLTGEPLPAEAASTQVALPGFETFAAPRFDPPSFDAPSFDAPPMIGQAPALVVPPVAVRELDDRTSPVVRRLELWRDEFVAWVKTLASAAVYATLIVTFGFQVARVEGQSMAPTLADQDRLIVNKLAYRLGNPQRGDIVMLYYPINPDKSFVKRVIAEESDTVRIVDGRVYVNDVPLRDDYVPPEYRSHDDWGPQVIPEGYYFVMGDHRNNSSDSRHWGFVPKKYIIGKVQLRWWPVPNGRVF